MKNQRKSNVLLIDDEPLVLEMFAYTLRAAGFRVKTAVSAEEGLHIFQRCKIDILVSDIRLGEFDGFDVACAARRQNHTLPVVLITGFPSEEEQARAERWNFGYLSKPMILGDLVRSVSRRMRIREGATQAAA